MLRIHGYLYSYMVFINITLLCSAGLKSHISNAMVVDSEGFTEGADSVSATNGDAEAEMSSDEEEEEQEKRRRQDRRPLGRRALLLPGQSQHPFLAQNRPATFLFVIGHSLAALLFDALFVFPQSR